MRNVGQHKAEILGICDIEEEIFASEVDAPNYYTTFPSVNELINEDFMNKNNPDGTPKGNKTVYRIEIYKQIHERQIDYSNENSVTYGNVKLYDLCLHNNTANSGHSIYLTFQEEKKFSQLEKYYVFVEKEAEKSAPKKTTGYFILLPNYAYKDTAKLNKYEKFDKYKIIRYSELLDFFKNCTTSLPYYEDFLKVLEYHASEYLNDLYSEILERLQSVISLKNNVMGPVS